MNRADWKLRLRALISRSRVEIELDEELQFHLAMQAHKHRSSGMNEPDAERQARLQFGGLQDVKEECRDTRGVAWLEAIWLDFRYALRGFRRSPGFLLTVVATIALGLGLNTALFTVFNAYALRPLSVRDPHSLYQVSWFTRTGGSFFTPQETQQIRRPSAAFSEVLSYEPAFARAGQLTLFGNRVSENYFSMLGVDASMGRLFVSHDRTENASAIVLSHNAWQAKFASDPAILGRKLSIFGGAYEVVGVARRGFNGIGQVPSDFWIAELDAASATQLARRTLVGRLATGITSTQAKAVLLSQATQLTADRPEAQRVTSVQLRSNETTIPVDPQSIAIFTPVAAAFVLVLLIACANVANMMLARSMARQREMGIRLSLGAGRSRLIQQLLAEGFALALPAAAAAYLISTGTIRVVEGLLFSTMPPVIGKMVRIIELEPDFRVFGFLAAASVLATLIFALVPAMQSTRISVSAASRGRLVEGGRPSRLRQALVVTQVTVCLLLLICAGILLQTSRQLAQRDPGLLTRGVAAVQWNQPVSMSVVDSLRTQPWVELAATAWWAPLSGGSRGISTAAEGSSVWIRSDYNFVSPEYFDLLRIAITQGRLFTAREAQYEAATVIVSDATAKRLWPGQNAIGQTLRITSTGWQMDRFNRLPKFRYAEVVGIAADVISGMVLDGKDAACLYFPSSQNGEQREALLVRLNSSATGMQSLESFLDGRVPAAILRLTSLDELFSTQIYPFRVGLFLSSCLGGLALVLTLSGMYGVLSHLVAQRTKEIGIRMALGATIAEVVRFVVFQSIRLASLGTVLGVLLALAVSRIFASAVPDVSMFDLLAYLGGVGSILAAALAAALVPSRRAARIEPSTTLRCD